MRIIHDQTETQRIYLEMVNATRKELLLILPSSNAYLREVDIGVIAALEAASRRGVKVRMLTPGPYAGEQVRKFNENQIMGSRSPVPIDYKRIQEAGKPNTVTILVTDRTSSLIIEEQHNSSLNFVEAIGVATYSKRGSTVKANIRFFERMWEEETLLEKERRSRQEAELLQDILAHDLRNYNQIIQTNAELLLEADVELPSSKRPAADILRAVSESTRLIERAKKLGKIISEETQLSPIDLCKSLERSIELVAGANEGRAVVQFDFTNVDHPFVLADDLLDEVFVNILSNSVLHGKRDQIPIEIRVEDFPTQDRRQTPGSRWKISFIDRGRGIPDELKGRLFTRYLDKASGSGLGLSIVHALVVDRYSGQVQIRNRIENDYTQGTTVEVLLKQVEGQQPEIPNSQ
jgi:two-component system, OmpR family, sensor histidine kinase VicK